MQRMTYALAGAAVSMVLAAGAGPAQAASPMAAPAVAAEGKAGIHSVEDRGWDGGWRHKRRHDDDFRFGFSFGAPYTFYPPVRSYPVYRCPYGSRFDGYGCVSYRSYHPYPYHYGVRPGFSVQLGF